MSTSDGGGYCDCGDSEAFTLYPSCSLHMQKEGTSVSSADVLANFPPGNEINIVKEIN